MTSFMTLIVLDETPLPTLTVGKKGRGYFFWGFSEGRFRRKKAVPLAFINSIFRHPRVALSLFWVLWSAKVLSDVLLFLVVLGWWTPCCWGFETVVSSA